MSLEEKMSVREITWRLRAVLRVLGWVGWEIEAIMKLVNEAASVVGNPLLCLQMPLNSFTYIEIKIVNYFWFVVGLARASRDRPGSMTIDLSIKFRKVDARKKLERIWNWRMNLKIALIVISMSHNLVKSVKI